MIVHKTRIVSGDEGFWVSCTCLISTYHRSRQEAESYAADHLANPSSD